MNENMNDQMNADDAAPLI
jgi:amino acid permease